MKNRDLSFFKDRRNTLALLNSVLKPKTRAMGGLMLELALEAQKKADKQLKAEKARLRRK